METAEELKILANGDSKVLNQLIKQYPRVIFKPVQLEPSNAIALITSASMKDVIVGVIDENGKLCKIDDPIEIKKLIEEEGLTDAQKDNIKAMFGLDQVPIVTTVTTQAEITFDNIMSGVKDKLSDEQRKYLIEYLTRETKVCSYNLVYDDSTNRCVPVTKFLEPDEIYKVLRVVSETFKEEKYKVNLAFPQLSGPATCVIIEGNNGKEDIVAYVRPDGSIKPLEKPINLTTEIGVESSYSLKFPNVITKEKLEFDATQMFAGDAEREDLIKQVKESKSFRSYVYDESRGISEADVQFKLDEQRQVCDMRISEEKEKLRGAEEQTTRLVENVDELKKQIDQYKADFMTWQETAKADWQAQLQTQIAEKDELFKRLGETSEERDQNTKVRENLEMINNELNRGLKDLQIQLEEKDVETKKLQEELAKAQQQLDEARTSLGQITMLPAIDYKSCRTDTSAIIELQSILLKKLEVIDILEGVLRKIPDEAVEGELNNIKNDVNEHMKNMEFERINEYTATLKAIENPDETLDDQIQYISKMCKEMDKKHKYWKGKKMYFEKLSKRLTNLYEDISGAVRVYIRIKPTYAEEKTIVREGNSAMVTEICSNNGRNKFGEFFGIFGEESSNEDVYRGVKETFSQVEDGYSIVLFGYGASGSGKTFTLLGNQNVPGIVQLGLGGLKEVENISIKGVFEQYIGKFNYNFKAITGKIHKLHGQIPKVDKIHVKDESSAYIEFLRASNLDWMLEDGVKQDENLFGNISRLVEATNEYRKAQADPRIKPTPNNPESSRSHLYLIFSIKFTTGKTGYVTCIDMAGRENPINIFNTYLKGGALESILSPPPVGGPEAVDRLKRPEFANVDSNDIYKIIEEGFYINETINHQVYYLRKKSGKVTKLAKQKDKYNPSDVYVAPWNEDENGKGVDVKSNCLSIPVLNYLNSLSKDEGNRPTKFVMLLAVRQESKYCNDIIETMEFADSVKST